MVVKLTVEIEAEIQLQAKALAEQQGRSLGDVVQSALELYIERSMSPEQERLIEIDPIFQLVGKYSGPPENVSENVEEILEADSDPIRGLSVRRGSNH